MKVDFESVAHGGHIIIAAVFFFAGILKMKRGWHQQLAILAAVGFRSSVLRAVVPVLAPLEVALGIWLLTGPYIAIALLIAGALLVLFSLILFAAIRGGYAGECACFGSRGAGQVGFADIVSNCLMLALVGMSLGTWSVNRAYPQAVGQIGIPEALGITGLLLCGFCLKALVRQMDLLRPKLTREAKRG